MASITKRNGKWQARVSWRDEDGQLHQKSKAGFATKLQAREYAAKLEAKRADGLNINTDPVFADYFVSWYETYRKPKVSASTDRAYQTWIKNVKEIFGSVKIKKITRSYYQKIVNDFGQNHAKQTVKALTSRIRACVRSAMADGIITRDFTHGVNLVYDENRTMKVEYLSIKELKLLIRTLETDLDPTDTPRYTILTAIYTGARLGEILGLTWNNIDFVHNTISITKSYDARTHSFKPTKNAFSVRTIRVSDNLLKLLEQRRQVSTSTMVFPNGNSVKINRHLRKYMAKAGISKRDFHFHSLRHTHVAFLLSQGVDLYAISQRLGHHDVTTTAKVYSYFIDEYKEKSEDLIQQKLENLG